MGKIYPTLKSLCLFLAFLTIKKCPVGPSKASDKYIQFIGKPLKFREHQCLVSTVLNLLNLPNLVTLKLFTFKVCQYMLLPHGLEICHNTYVAIVETHMCENIYQI